MKWLILIIVLVVLVTILILNFKEGFKSDYSDYTDIDRIKVDDKYAYCIGSSPRCETGAPIKGGVYNGGTTYKSICDDGSNMVCNNFLSNIDISNEYTWKTPNNTPIMFSNIYKGFTEPTSYIPAIINENTINFYDSKNHIIDSIDKCSILGINMNNCKKALKIPFKNADLSNNINFFNDITGYKTDPDVIGNFISSYTEIPPISEGTSGMYPNLPCIADHGANIGDNVCNGEVGLIQDKTLVCPHYKPICSGYRCGSTFGTCSYSNE
jgi:hypothetical protein